MTSHRAGLCFSLKTATTLSHTICHFLQIGEGRQQFQPQYGSLRGDDHPVDHFTQQFLLAAAFQPVIQYTHFCNDGERCIQIGNVNFVVRLQRLQRMTQGAPPILPLRPQILPDAIRDFAGGVEPQRPRLFFVNILQFPFEIGTLVGTHSPQPVGNLLIIAVADEWDQVRVHLNFHQFMRYLLIHRPAQDVDTAALDAVVRCATPGTSSIGGRSGQSQNSAIVQLNVDQSTQQVIMHPPTAGAVFLPRCENGETLLKFLRRHDWLPLSLHRFRGNARFLTDDPTGIKPVIQDARQSVGGRFASASGAHRHERTATAKPIPPGMEFFANFGEGVLVGQQQIPGGAPHLELLRVWLNPAVVAPGAGLVDLFRLFFTVDIAIRGFANKTARSQLGVQPTRDPLTEFNGLAPRQGKGQADQNTVIRVNRIEVRIVGKAHGNTQFVQRINGDQRFRIVASKTFRIFDGNVRETARTRIFQHPLIIRAIIGVPSTQVINVFIEHRQFGTLK